jgi:hypothetical protein
VKSKVGERERKKQTQKEDKVGRKGGEWQKEE